MISVQPSEQVWQKSGKSFNHVNQGSDDYQKHIRSYMKNIQISFDDDMLAEIDR